MPKAVKAKRTRKRGDISTRPQKAHGKGFKKSRLNKYNAAGRHVNGVWCASDGEAKRYEELLAMEEAGVVKKIITQPSFNCTVSGKHICHYRADFQYTTTQDNRIWVEDVKGMITDVYRIKKKLTEAIHRIDIIEIPSKMVHAGGTVGLTAPQILNQKEKKK